jgi:hypothetical protein
MRKTRLMAAGIAMAALALAGCNKSDDTVAPQGAAPAAPAGPATAPLANADGTGRGLAPVTSAADKAAGRALIDKLRTAPNGPKTGYSRDQYGTAWSDKASGVPLSGNKCDTRDDILKRDGANIQYKDKASCVVSTMTLPDPYTGKDIAFTKSKASTVQIDHIVPLSASWQMGADKWPAAKRMQLANDPLNLLAVDGPTNGGKGDSMPAAWLPPNPNIRCAYVIRYAQVSLKYDLPVTPADKTAMAGVCG